VRNWKIVFVQQSHIINARNWLSAVGHAIKEVVDLHRCGCGKSYVQWGSPPTPPCPTCEKTRFRQIAPDEKEAERTERAGKRTKYEESKDKGKKIVNTLPHQTKETRQSPTGLIVVLSQLEHLSVEAIWPRNNHCEIGSLISLIRAISNSRESAGSPFLYQMRLGIC